MHHQYGRDLPLTSSQSFKHHQTQANSQLLNSGPVIGFCYQIEIFGFTYPATSCVQESLDHLRYFTGDLLLRTDSIESQPLIMSLCSDWWSLVPWHETVPHSLVLAHVFKLGQVGLQICLITKIFPVVPFFFLIMMKTAQLNGLCQKIHLWAVENKCKVWLYMESITKLQVLKFILGAKHFFLFILFLFIFCLLN